MSTPAKETFACYAECFRKQDAESFVKLFKTPLPVYIGTENAIVLSSEKLAGFFKRQTELVSARRLQTKGEIEAISQQTPDHFRLSAEWQFFSDETEERHSEKITYFVRETDNKHQIEIIQVDAFTNGSPCIAALKSIQNTDGDLI